MAIRLLIAAIVELVEVSDGVGLQFVGVLAIEIVAVLLWEHIEDVLHP